jgi:hypothetical protein
MEHITISQNRFRGEVERDGVENSQEETENIRIQVYYSNPRRAAHVG